MTDALDSEGVETIKQLYLESDLRVMGVMMDEKNFSAHLRDAMSKANGPVHAPTVHADFRKNMVNAGPKPNWGKKTRNYVRMASIGVTMWLRHTTICRGIIKNGLRIMVWM